MVFLIAAAFVVFYAILRLSIRSSEIRRAQQYAEDAQLLEME